MLIWSSLSSPKHCYRLSGHLLPYALIAAAVCTAIGLLYGLKWAPPDYQQGDAYRILFIHVPAAVFSLGIYTAMTGLVFLHLVWKIKVADMLAVSLLPIGALFTFLTLVTGSLWGKPMWGTFWIWDARLTAELVLLFIYLGILALRTSMPDEAAASRAGGFMTLVGAVNLPIVHYSVIWWHTLHQGPTVLKWGAPAMAPVMLWPLLWMVAAYGCYTLAWVILRFQTEVLRRESDRRWVQQLLQEQAS